MKIKVEFELDINENFWCSHLDEKEMEWFLSLLNDGESTSAILWSNEVGDEIGSTTNFKYEIL